MNLGPLLRKFLIFYIYKCGPHCLQMCQSKENIHTRTINKTSLNFRVFRKNLSYSTGPNTRIDTLINLGFTFLLIRKSFI